MTKQRHYSKIYKPLPVLMLLAGVLMLALQTVQASKSPDPELVKAIAQLSARGAPPAAYAADNSMLLPAGLLHESLWQRLRMHFQFADLQHPAIDRQVEHFKSGLFSLRSNLIDAGPFLYFIADEIDRAGLPIDFAMLPLVESAYNPHALSNRDALGMWQFIPSTAKKFGLNINQDYDGRKDIVASTRAAIRYLERLGKTFDGDWLLAMAAYNTGPGNVRSAMARARAAGLEPTFWNLKLATETRNYVPRIIAATRMISNPTAYGLNLPPISNRKVISTVATGRPVSLSQVAELIDEPEKQLTSLNPGYLNGHIPSGGPYQITVPTDKSQLLVWQLNNDKLGATNHQTARLIEQTAAGFNASVTSTDPRYPANAKGYTFKAYKSYVYHTHVVKRGESLWTISRAMDTDIDTLQDWNGKSEKPLQPGDKMIVAYLDEEQPTDNLARLMNYRVHADDSLISISDKFRMPISVIKKWNPSLWHKNHLQTGQSIKIPLPMVAATPGASVPEL